jgi:hypothetical protein
MPNTKRCAMRATRAQAQYKGKLADQREARAQFETQRKKFRVLAWGKQNRSAAQSENLKLGRMGRVKRYASSNVTLCDMDSQRAPTLERAFRIARILGIRIRWVRLDRSHSGRWHMLIEWAARFSKLETIALQAMLGSDYKRELFNLYRVRSGVKSRRWNFLFESKLDLGG